MNFEFNWHVPVGGDSPWICTPAPIRAPRVSYLTHVARAAEEAGFDGVLVPCAFSNGSYGLDSPYVDAFTTGVACLGATTRLKVLVAHRPGFINPGVFAHMCATADELSSGRLALNIVTAGVPGDMEQFGDRLGHDERYERAAEFVEVLRALWGLQDLTYDGKYFQMTAARLAAMPTNPRAPQIYLVGASRAAVKVAAAQADVYMLQAHTIGETARRIGEVRDLAKAMGRRPRFAVSARVIAAETDEEARRRMREFVRHADPIIAADHALRHRRTVSVEDLRLRAAGDVETFLAPNIWSGVAHLTHGTAWVGSYEAIAELICQFADVGAEIFQLAGHPYLEEAYRVGEHVIPLAKEKLRARQSKFTDMTATA